jgi:hypothetical protein
VWIGDLDGTADAYWLYKIHKSGKGWLWDRINFGGTLFDDYEVELVIQLVGKQAVGEDWFGTWVIISSTGGVHGQGTWWGPGFDEDPSTPDVYYEGKVHIDPD